MRYPTLLGCGIDVPQTVLTNDELSHDLLLVRDLLLDPSKPIPSTLFKTTYVPRQIVAMRTARRSSAFANALEEFLSRRTLENLPSESLSPCDVRNLLRDLADARLEFAVPMGEKERKQFETDDAWIYTRTGIRERRVAPDAEAVSDLATRAIRRALDSAELKPDDLEFILVASVFPDHLSSPPTASIIQEKLGVRVLTDEAIRDVFIDDSEAACTSFMQALRLGCCLIQSGHFRQGVVVGADIMTRLANWFDRSTCILFGDAAGAWILGATDQPEQAFLPEHFHSGSIGRFANLIRMQAGGSRRVCVDPSVILNPFSQLLKLEMGGRAVYEIIVPFVGDRLIPAALARAGIKPETVDVFVPHQANGRMTEAVAHRLRKHGFRSDLAVISNISRYGNTTSASIPLAIYEACEEGRIKSGDCVLLAAFGGGFTWSTCVIPRWPKLGS